ncbi:MAG: hypothetical protein LVQ63_07300 [Thermoplasmatales archaeon]|nr:hypothetical protein [Thermoplasmatales archaeon]
MKSEAKFPTFKCFITRRQEDYDSGVWEFFRHYDFILSDLGKLKLDDGEWKENYIQLMRYYHDLGDSIIMNRNPPDSGFMTAFISKEIEGTDAEDVLLRAKDRVVATLLRTGADLEILMAEYVRLSKIPRFSRGFSLSRFEGFGLLAKSLYSRGIEISKR